MEQVLTPFFSIITVCLNAEETIRATMDSVLAQTWQDLEYIIVDGASRDATLDIVQELAKADKRIKWRSEPDTGIFNAMNKGISLAKGVYLLFLNAGDSLHSEDVLEKAAKVSVGADIVIGDVAFKKETGLSEYIYPVGAGLLRDLKRGRNVCHQVIFASRQCLSGGFDESFMSCADYDWLCSQVTAGKKIVKLDAVVTDFDIQGVTFQVRHQKRHWKEYFEVIEKYFPQPGCAYADEIKALFVQQRKEHCMYMFMDRWLALKQQGVRLSTFFSRQGMLTVAIYGIRRMGERLYEELRDSEVKVAYVIDRVPAKLPGGIKVLRPDEELELVDAVVITPIFDFLEIRDKLSAKLDCPMIFIEDVLFYRYEDLGNGGSDDGI